MISSIVSVVKSLVIHRIRKETNETSEVCAIEMTVVHSIKTWIRHKQAVVFSLLVEKDRYKDCKTNFNHDDIMEISILSL